MERKKGQKRIEQSAHARTDTVDRENKKSESK